MPEDLKVQGNYTDEHVYPTNDWMEHWLTVQCLCKPRVEDYYGNRVIIHNPFDARMKVGKRKYEVYH